MSSTGERRRYHHGDLRATLIAQARALLDRDGAEAVSFREIARAAGVSATAPYNHFASRRDLLAALATDGFTELAARQESAANAAQAGEQRLVAIGHAYLEFAEERPQLYRLMFGTGVQHWHDLPVVAAAKAASFQPIRSAIAEHLATRGDGESLEIASLTAWSTVHGLAMLLIDGSLQMPRDGVHGLGLATVAVRWFVTRSLTA